ncbi:MAG: hypothetical protein ACI9QL_004477 [Candidatus Omnitrophota bacterium]|jgi:hypothetical protein
MGLLFPLYLLGAAAIAAPILLHLTRRTPKEHVPFSSLMFLRETPLRLTKRSRLENLLLLFLRCLALLLLALAFARPLWKSDDDGTALTGTSQVLYLLDTSASMAAPEQMERAREALLADLQDRKSGDRAAVFQFNDQTEALIDFEAWTQLQPSGAIKQLRQVPLPPQGGSRLGEALVQAAHHLDEQAREYSEHRQQELVVISDLQEGMILDALFAYEWPQHLQVRLLPIATPSFNNASLQWVQDAGEVALSDERPSPWIRVSNQAGADQTVLHLAWANNAGQPLSIEVPGGQSKIIKAPATASGIPGEELVLSGDDLDYDNHLFLAPIVEKQINVLFIGSGDAKDAERPFYFLRRALLGTRIFTPVITVRRGSDSLADIEVSAIDFAVITEPPADTSVIEAFLKEGGTVLYMVSQGDSGEALQQLTGEPITLREAEVKDFALLGHLDLKHPWLEPFSDPQFGDFSKIHFWHHRILEGSTAPVLARFDGRHPALLELQIGKGHLVILAAGWQPDDSQLSLSSRFVPLLYSILEYGQHGMGGHHNMMVTGSSVPIPEGTRQVQHPDGTVHTIAEDLRAYTETRQPGVYHFLGPDLDSAFAINLPSAESRIGPLPHKERQQLAALGQLKEQPGQTEAAAGQGEVEQRQKLWRWLILGLWAALLLETGIAGRGVRAIKTPQAAEYSA